MPTPAPRTLTKKKILRAPEQPVDGAAQTPVSRIMTRKVATLTPDTSVESAVELMIERGYSRIPVVNDDGKPIGVFSKSDVVRNHHEEGDTEELVWKTELPARRGVKYPVQGMHIERVGSSVGEVMSKVLYTVRETDSIADLAKLLSVKHVHGVPVVSRLGKLVGVVSALDIAAWVAGIS